MAEKSTAPRTWAGSTLEARRAQRREALVDATLNIIGLGGTTAVSVRSVCRQAKLTDRYFYESFPSRDELLVEILQDILAEVFAAMTDVIATIPGKTKVAQRRQARAAAETAMNILARDPRKARLLFVESLSEPALTRAGIGGMPMLSRALRSLFPTEGSRSTQNMRSVATSGALASLFVAWQSGTLKVPLEELIDYCADLIVKG